MVEWVDDALGDNDDGAEEAASPPPREAPVPLFRHLLRSNGCLSPLPRHCGRPTSPPSLPRRG